MSHLPAGKLIVRTCLGQFLQGLKAIIYYIIISNNMALRLISNKMYTKAEGGLVNLPRLDNGAISY